MSNYCFKVWLFKTVNYPFPFPLISLDLLNHASRLATDKHKHFHKPCIVYSSTTVLPQSHISPMLSSNRNTFRIKSISAHVSNTKSSGFQSLYQGSPSMGHSCAQVPTSGSDPVLWIHTDNNIFNRSATGITRQFVNPKYKLAKFWPPIQPPRHISPAGRPLDQTELHTQQHICASSTSAPCHLEASLKDAQSAALGFHFEKAARSNLVSSPYLKYSFFTKAFLSAPKSSYHILNWGLKHNRCPYAFSWTTTRWIYTRVPTSCRNWSSCSKLGSSRVHTNFMAGRKSHLAFPQKWPSRNGPWPLSPLAGVSWMIHTDLISCFSTSYDFFAQELSSTPLQLPSNSLTKIFIYLKPLQAQVHSYEAMPLDALHLQLQYPSKYLESSSSYLSGTQCLVSQ